MKKSQAMSLKSDSLRSAPSRQAAPWALVSSIPIGVLVAGLVAIQLLDESLITFAAWNSLLLIMPFWMGSVVTLALLRRGGEQDPGRSWAGSWPRGLRAVP